MPKKENVGKENARKLLERKPKIVVKLKRTAGGQSRQNTLFEQSPSPFIIIATVLFFDPGTQFSGMKNLRGDGKCET